MTGLSERAIQQVPAFLREVDAELAQTAHKFWHSLQFMERNSIDIGFRADTIKYCLLREGSPIADCDLSPDDWKRVFVEIRNAARIEAGLACLAPDERSAWKLKQLPPSRPRRGAGETYTVPIKMPAEPSDSEALARLEQSDPELARALVLFAAYNDSHDSEWDHQLPTFWLVSLVARALEDIYAGLSGWHINELALALIDGGGQALPSPAQQSLAGRAPDRAR